ncbi:hypothetical protein SAMN05216436_12184 [bacterium A37T11]|nr:hypothetical protein SAMN05216436_12184 [bacterium A37T11]
MRTERVLTNYSKISDADLSTLAGKTLTAITGNVHFPNPIPTVDDYTLLVNDYRTKHEAAAETGGKFEKTAKDLARLALEEAIKRIASYVNFTANGNANMLVSSGFTLATQPQDNSVPAVPLWVRLRDGSQRGQFRMDIAPVRSAWEFEFQVSNTKDEMGNIVWGNEVFATTRTRGTIIPNLQSVQTYWVRVRARNGRGQGDWSEPVSGVTK